MGHVQQLCRVLRVCKERGFPLPSLILLASRDKVPHFILDKFAVLAPEAEVVDMGFEVAYDSERGTEINNLAVFKEGLAGYFSGKGFNVIWIVYNALMKHRPCFILNCFDPYVGLANHALFGPAKLICCASQGSIVTQGREEGGNKESKGFLMTSLVKGTCG